MMCSEVYDGGSFETFPSRKGLTLERRSIYISFTREGVTVSDDGTIADFMQTWLYFGFLSEAVSHVVDYKKFIRRTSNGDELLSSACLEQIVATWSERIVAEPWSSDVENLQAWRDNVYSCLLKTRDIVLRVVVGEGQRFGSLLMHVCLGIAVLCEGIFQALHDILNRKQVETPVPQKWRTGPADCAGPIMKTMRSNGWCLGRLAFFAGQSSLRSTGELWYFANLRKTGPEGDHHACTSEGCALLQVDVSNYSIMHTSDGCKCSFRGLSTNFLADAVTSDTLPLVTVADDPEHASIHLSAHQSSVVSAFTAISHVWADGRGNPTDNTLPQCVLRQLQSYVDDLPKPDASKRMPFWIDTLCLPRQPLPLRRLGCKRLNIPFEQATHVLVIDSSLNTLSTKGMDTREILARVTACSWTQRLWTFNEGRLAKNLWFQF